MDSTAVLLAPRHPDDDIGPLIAELTHDLFAWYSETITIKCLDEDDLVSVEGATDLQIDQVLDHIDPGWTDVLDHVRIEPTRAAVVVAAHERPRWKSASHH